jgi:hypothetical protein
MEFNDVADYFGLTGTTLFVLHVLWILKQKFLKTKCTEGADGSYHLDISIAKEDYDVIKGNADLLEQLNQLKAAIGVRRQASQTTVTSSSPLPTPRNVAQQDLPGTSVQIA